MQVRYKARTDGRLRRTCVRTESGSSGGISNMPLCAGEGVRLGRGVIGRLKNGSTVFFLRPRVSTGVAI